MKVFLLSLALILGLFTNVTSEQSTISVNTKVIQYGHGAGG